ncbi:MAG: ribokinase [Acidobacteria bacterium]|nr:ribokinase [Acidobacteriota bacterium]
MTTDQILTRFTQRSAVVIGDICLDRWCTYDPGTAEPSRETGIPRIGVVATETSPGAGGTVANNLAALGVGKVAVLGVIGQDGFGMELKRALEARGIQPNLLVEAPEMQTFTYTKLINSKTGAEDLSRVDFITTKPLDAAVERRILDQVQARASQFDVILVSDQSETSAGGVVTPSVRELMAAMARKNPEKVIWVDSRMRSELFRDVIVKPNQQEAEGACQRLYGRIDYYALRNTVGRKPMIITHGSDGAYVVEDTGITHVKTRAIAHPVDICGAGDSFNAGAAMAMAVTGSAVEAARIGNLVAQVTIMKKGTGVATPAEVLAAAR